MRIDSLDILKGIGIILVVVGHMIGNQLYIRPWIYAFHMPLFFMIAGFFYERSIKKVGYWRFVRSKFERLMFPYFILSWTIIGIKILVDGFMQVDHPVSIRALYRVFYLPEAGYFLWFVYVAGTLVFFLFHSKEDYYKMCTFLFSGMTLSLIICTFFHNGTDFRPVIDPNKNIFSAAVAALYKTDTCTNVFPSIHVYNAVGTHIAISRSQILAKYRFLRLGSLLLTISICLATMFLKQHSIIDVCGAFLMSYAIHYLVYGYATDTEDKKITEKALG